MGEYDAGLLLSAADDPALPAGIEPGAALSLDTVRGSPFVQLTLQKISALNLSFWNGHQFVHSSQTVSVGGKEHLL